MSIAEEAFKQLYPEKGTDFEFVVNYSDKFSPYNANVRKTGNKLVFGLSKKWKTVSREIVIGLIQDLLLRILKDSKKTTNTDLYSNFVKGLHISIPKSNIHPVLLESFNRVNAKYFYGSAELPNLVFGHDSKRKLASYNYHTDTISVSSIFKSARTEIIDYLIFHELLHKELKFRNSNSKTIHHSGKFRKLEHSFENQEALDKEISRIVRKRALLW